MDDYAAFEKLAPVVYIAARAGAVDCSDGFDLAASAMKLMPSEPLARELVALCLECADESRQQIAEVALQLLDAANFTPSFAEEPEWLDRLEKAAHIVNRDLAATGLQHLRGLRIFDDPPDIQHANVLTWDYHTAPGPGILPRSGADPVTALVATADNTQCAVMHSLSAAWPLCADHRLGVHPLNHENCAVWWCNGDGGHVAAAIGEWRHH